MSVNSVSCCTPCAATPAAPATGGGGAPMKGVEGGGDVATDAPIAPTDAGAAAPEPGAQPAPPTDGDVTGGGPSTQQSTGFDASAPDPTCCGTWVPAPVATGDTPPTGAPSGTDGGDTPPEPTAVPG